MPKALDTPVQYLKGIGPKRSKTLNKIGVSTIEDLLYYFPRRYQDRTTFSPIAQLKDGVTQTIQAEVVTKSSRQSFRHRSFSLVELTVADASGKIACVWFNQPYLKDIFQVGQKLILYGRAQLYGQKLQISAPEFEIVTDEASLSLNVGRIVPIYSLPQGFSQRNLRIIIKHALEQYLTDLADFLPYDLRARQNLDNLAKALINIHFPEDLSTQKDAYRRLSFEEFFLFQLPLVLRKIKKKEQLGICHRAEGKLVEQFIRQLPFSLTAAQEKVVSEIKLDMATPVVMQRLLQGDVGSGKTVVATIACLIAIQGGYQAAFMVPTEILARQHFEKISVQLSAISRQSKSIKVELLVSSHNAKEKTKIYQELREGKIDLIIGTHALLEEGVKFKNLGLVVIDEQHKFGVSQRLLLPAKARNPDCLIMTATPIPRTLAITLYASLDVSVINQLPQGRVGIQTKWIQEDKRDWLNDFIRQQLKLGRQAYIIYPVIEESFALDLEGAKQMYHQLKSAVFKSNSVGLVHGKLKDDEQQKTMSAFKANKIQILVATTVLEVGIDIPNATVMVIEHAERFGLSTLHQLRGRIGRGGHESFCFMVSQASSEEARQRLAAMEKYRDGFMIAEEDLRIRGPGEFFGQRQHGLSDLRIGNPLTQLQLLKNARQEAIKLTQKDPRLEQKEHAFLKRKLAQRFPEYQNLISSAIA